MSAAEALQDLPSEIDVDRELVLRGGLYTFVMLAWHLIEADPFVPSWHLEEICKHLEAVSDGRCKRLIINIPPGCSKSRIVSVLWPVWDWLRKPSRKWMFGTFDQMLMHRDAIDCRRIVRSEWFQARWGDRVRIADGKDDQTTQSVYNTAQKGRRVSVTVAGKGTGWHCEIQVVDDPTNPKDIRSGDPEIVERALSRTWEWWRGTMASRKSNPKTFARVIIMQRLHELDLVGRLLDEEGDEWTLLCLPMEFEIENKCVTPFGGDQRTEEGELLVPARFDADTVRITKRELGSQNAAAQLQQRPTPGTGNIFKIDWFKERWLAMDESHIAKMFLCISADCTFKDTSSADFVAIHVWAYDGAKFYLLDRIHDRLGLPATVAAIKALVKRWPTARAKLIEDKANGPAVEQSLRGKLPGIIMLEPKKLGGSKVARAHAVSPIAEAKDIVLPDPQARFIVTERDGKRTVITYEWVEEMTTELCSFPFGRNDDDVDAMTQAIIYLDAKLPPRYLQALKNIKAGKIPSIFTRER